MKIGLSLGCFALMLTTLAAESFAGLSLPRSTPLEALVERAAATAFADFAPQKLERHQLAISLVDLTDPAKPVGASYRGDVAIYPASVIKLCYLHAAHRWLEDGRIADTPELRRALRDMIVDSYNEATHYVVDALTDTTSGPELPDAELKLWWDKRNAVNRYFSARGYTGVNANMKPWCEGPYGREMQALQTLTPSRNKLTTDAAARLVLELVTGQAVTAERSRQMRELMQRDPTAPPSPDDQTTGFTASGLPAGAQLWSKAGWTSETRHDAAYVELADGRKFVLATFTTDHAKEERLIPTVARVVCAGLRK
jgi:beta-lactamase class A